jgi:hypothetical protein
MFAWLRVDAVLLSSCADRRLTNSNFFVLRPCIFVVVMPHPVSTCRPHMAMRVMLRLHVLTRGVVSVCPYLCGHVWSALLEMSNTVRSQQERSSSSMPGVQPCATTSTHRRLTSTAAITIATACTAVRLTRRQSRPTASRATRSNRRTRQTRSNATRNR